MAQTYTVEQLTALAAQAGFDRQHAPIMGAIAYAESSGRASVINSIGATGLWQVNQPVWVKSEPRWSKTWLQNPQNNAAAAYHIFQVQGLKAWTTYTSGAYRRYLPKQSLVDSIFSDFGGILSGVLSGGKNIAGDIGGVAGGAVSNATAAAGSVVSPFSAIANALETPVKALAWIVNPASWVRITAAAFGFLLMLVGLYFLSGAASA